MEKLLALDILKAWNFWGQGIETGIPRRFYSERIAALLNESEIGIVIETGIRRAGKSFIARQVAKGLIEKGFPKNRILIINLEDERLIDRSYASLLKMYDVYKENFNPDKSSIVIIDEAQEVEGWERFVRGLSEKGEAKFIVTGSSSKLLDSEYSTLLSGRQVVVYVHTLNLLEYQKFAGPDGNAGRFIAEGGFPAIALSASKEDIASNYFNTIILKDVIQRFRIQKQDELIRLAKFYITSVGSRVTFNSVSKFLKLSVKTAYNFSHYLGKSYLIFFVDRFSFSIKAQDNSPKKIYSTDNAFPSMLGVNPIEIRGRLLENAIASMLYMISRHEKDFHFYYWYENNKEVDFVIKDKRKYEIVQVAYSVEDEKTRSREVSALLECANRLNLEEAEIVTMDYSGEELINGIRISYKKASDWIGEKLDHYGFR
ncbi:ATPase [mine drainage metagenome]|uniref:ATPase n=1 Tax=mine drainage metagenome TaxID=410659 RepID=T1B869_9ZZZZ